MAEALGAVTMTARTDAFFDVLDGRYPKSVAMIHFAGHGRVDTGQRDGGIQLEDDFVGVVDVDQTRTVVGLECATLVLLNACETSAGARMLGTNTGWGAAIAARGFGGLVAPLWEVDDAMALEMMKAALPPLMEKRQTLGEALRTARQAHRAASASAFAYLAHGDVMATLPS
jgi:CHAT domain-containing protein